MSDDKKQTEEFQLLLIEDMDLNRRRVVNAGLAQDPQDYITLQDLRNGIAEIS